MREKNITEVTDFSNTEWRGLISESVKFSKNLTRKPSLLKNKRVGLVFDSNSLRTRLSFETAAYLLGGSSYFIDVHSVTHEQDGSKRESYEDIIETLDRMVDCYVLRDYSRDMYEIFLRKSSPPFINGFCAKGHPSQALADLSVITSKVGTTKDLQYVAVGPDSGSGVLESFIYGVLLLGEGITIITPSGKFEGKNHDFTDQVKKLEKLHGGSLRTTKEVSKTIKQADVLYVDEWWENNKNFLKKTMGKYRVDKNFLKTSKDSLAILHCLPAHHGREITEDVIMGEQSIIFDQAEFKTYAAMSMLAYLALPGAKN